MIGSPLFFPSDRPSLRGAKLRTQRAADHIAEIETVVTQWATENSDAFVMTAPKSQIASGEGVRPNFDWSRATPAPSTWVGIVAGESLYNLRAGLDYLVHALAWLDSGTPQEYTQFPIAHSPTEFQKQKQRRLTGVTQTHIEALAGYQPFNGCEWMATLQKLSNPDKHRTLTSVHREFSGSFRIEPETLIDDPADPERVIIPQSEIKLTLRFWNESPVVETLKLLARETAGLVFSFQSDFGETDELKFAD